MIAEEMTALRARIGRGAPNVRLFLSLPEHWKCETDARLSVPVARVSGTAGPEGHGVTSFETVRVHADLAGDLARRPEAVISAAWGDGRGIMAVTVDALGLIEAEAEEAFNAVSAALEEAAA